ncbi:MAG: hypothetical protein OCC49_18805 [Fibrobacterales bacterium]
MKKSKRFSFKTNILFFLFIGLSSVSAKYQPKSEYFEHPERIIEFAEGIGEFRLKAKDLDNGGWFSYVDRSGNPTFDDSNPYEKQSIKCMNTQSRVAYLYTRLFMMTGKEEYLEHARYALKFLYTHGWKDGWVFITDLQGNLDTEHWGNLEYWSFIQHYGLLGPAVMVEATGGDSEWSDGLGTDKEWLFKGVASLYDRLWDSNPDHRGYYMQASLDWSEKTGKGFTSNVDAITTHAYLMAAMYGGEHSTRLTEIGQVLVDHLVGSMDKAAIGFPERFDKYWNPKDTIQSDLGHHVKTSWVLARAYLMDTDQGHFKTAAKKILWDHWDNGGYDKTNGGIFSYANWQTGEIFHTAKMYWMLEQGYNAGIMNYYIADTEEDKDMYLEMADGNLDFYMKHQLDSDYGDNWAEVSADGSEVVEESKGGLFNTGYHTVEWAFYVYMYGGLYYTHVPVSLYYKYPPRDTAWSITLTPIAIQNDSLSITAVTLDGEDYLSFDGASRTLNFEAGVGGKVKVTFEMNSAISQDTLTEVNSSSSISLSSSLSRESSDDINIEYGSSEMSSSEESSSEESSFEEVSSADALSSEDIVPMVEGALVDVSTISVYWKEVNTALYVSKSNKFFKIYSLNGVFLGSGTTDSEGLLTLSTGEISQLIVLQIAP